MDESFIKEASSGIIECKTTKIVGRGFLLLSKLHALMVAGEDTFLKYLHDVCMLIMKHFLMFLSVEK